MTKNNIDLAPARLTESLAAKNRRRRQDCLAIQSVTAEPIRHRRNDLTPNLALEQVAVADLKTLPNRTRRITPGHVREVARSIEAHGFCVPLLVVRAMRSLMVRLPWKLPGCWGWHMSLSSGLGI